MKRPKPSPAKGSYTESDFLAEGAYADSILRTALGDHEGSIAALRRSLECKPTYAPAILSLGSVEYQLGKRAEGQALFRSLLSLPKDTPDLCEIIDEAGSFLIQIGAWPELAGDRQMAVFRVVGDAVQDSLGIESTEKPGVPPKRPHQRP